jgi:hypothetical protein
MNEREGLLVVKIKLNKNVTIQEDQEYKTSVKLDPGSIQDPSEILLSRGYERFRFLLTNFDVEDVALLICLNNERLNKRIYLHFSEVTKRRISDFIRAQNKLYSNEEMERGLSLIDFEMHLL